MKKYVPRIPKNYDGTSVTTHRFSELLSSVLSQINETYSDRPDLILASWPDIIGPKLADMTQAVALNNGVLTVKVKNSTLHSLLCRRDKSSVLAALRARFPRACIQNIVFRIG